ncbi:MAG: sugar-binding protein [Pirellulales bacterium]
MRLPAVIVLLVLVLATVSRVAPGQGLQSNHGVLRAVPVPRPVEVDGKLDEWDTSAEMFAYGVRRLRDRYSVRVSAMWDANALYLGLRWRDPTPLINNVDVDASPGDGWMADSFQGRFIVSGRQVHLTTCYSSRKDKSAAVLEYDAALNQAGRRVFVTPGKTTRDSSGFAQAFVLASDHRGYVQELRLPWAMLGKEFQPQAGAQIGFTGEYFWGNASGTTWPAVMWSDPINPQNPVRVVVYQNPGVWGKMELLGTGNLPRPPEVEDDSRLTGTLPLRFTVPADAVKFSVVIEDEQGRRVRNLIAHANVSDYLVASPAPGSPPQPAKAAGEASRTLEVPWDLRPDGGWNPERLLFVGEQTVAAGRYTARCVVHRGIGVTYAGSFYNPGTPPWPTADGKGAWGFDHAPPSAVAAVPRGAKTQGRVFLGWETGECGVGFIGLDAQGRKLWEWLRRGAGATCLATTAEHVYFTFISEGARLGRVLPDNGEQVPFASGSLDLRLPEPPAGLAVRESVAALSLPKRGAVQFLDLNSGQPQREITVEQPGALTWLPDGTLLGVARGGLFRIPPVSPDLQWLKAPGEPRSVAADSLGQVFLGDQRQANVAIFPSVPHNVTGQLRTLGVAGGHPPGPWNPQRMGTPRALAVEERDDKTSHVWVVEDNQSPRRISVWDAASGQLVRDYIGNTRYSGSGGFLSDDVPGVGFVDGVKFQLDLATGAYTPLEVLGGAPRPVAGASNVFTLGKGAGNFANPYHFLSAASGTEREYVVEAGGTQPMVFMRRGDRWQCVAALGTASQSLPPGLPPPPSPTAAFSWHDANGDGHQQADEIVWHDLGEKRLFQCGWGYRCGRDLVFYHSGFAFRPERFTADGAPVYDVRRAERLPGELGQTVGDIRRTRFGYVADLGSGEVVDRFQVVHGLHHVAGFDTSGKLRWKYPNYWVSVHGAFTAPMALPGVLMGVLKMTGIIEAAPSASRAADSSAHDSSAHDIVSLRGNIGQEFLIRDDGVYLGELFTDQRMAPADLPPTRDIVGAPINETTLGGEPFNGWTGRQRDGRVRMTYGLTDVRIAEVVGLERVTDLPPQAVAIGETELAAARAFQPRLAVARKTAAELSRGPAFTDDELTSTGTFGDAPDLLVIRAGREEVGRARLRWDESGLHLACQVADQTPLINKGTSAPLAFTSGDSVSLYVSAADGIPAGQQGGTRVLFTSLRGRPTTVIYRPKGPGESPFEFTSPVRQSRFAYVASASDISFATQPSPGGYLLRATVPWPALGLRPAGDQRLRGDVGLLFGDDSGASTAQRVHWVDRETNVVNDTPTEAEFFPERWGTWTLRDGTGKSAGTNTQSPPATRPSSAPVAQGPAPPPSSAGWRTVYRETFDELPVGLQTTAGALASWEGGSASGVVRDGGAGSTSGRYLAQLTPWQHFNFGPVLNLDLRSFPHTHVRVRFQLYTFGDWHGLHGKGSPHSLGLFDSRASQPIGKYFALATVPGARQSWPDPLPASTHPAATGAQPDERIDLAPSHLQDHRWPVTFEYVSGSESLRFAILSGWHSLGGPPLPEPTFGLDDVQVEVLDARTATTSPAPEPLAPAPTPTFRWLSATSPGQQGRVDLKFALDAPGFVTLAIENSDGVRVRNLIGETPFAAGEHVVSWDGRDETCRNFRVCGQYDLDPQPVPAGKYRVRGLVRPALEARYELTVNNAGNPPWPKQDGTGRWLADHSPPSAVLFLPPGRTAHRGFVRDAAYQRGDSEFIPTDEPLMLIASHVAESGDGLVWCDLAGRKRRGIRSLGAGGGWCGAEQLARDAGSAADPNVYAYAATGWKDAYELRTLPAGEVIFSSPVRSPSDVHCSGLAVHNRLAALTLRPVNQLVLIDTRTRQQIGRLSLDAIGGVTFDDQGHLLVAARQQILRFADLLPGQIEVDAEGQLAARHAPRPWITEGLSAPGPLLFDQGELFVGDLGTSQQVKVFNAQGQWQRTVGQPGGSRLGPYRPAAMQQPAGLSIDSQGRLWVAEADYSPKRVSVWSRAGQFERAFYGPPGYGGGGTLDPWDPTRFYLAYGSGLEFQIDWQSRTSIPIHRYWHDTPETLRLGADWHAAPQTPLQVAGRRYMTNAFSNHPGGFGPVVGIWRFENGLALPAAAAGAFAEWPPLQAQEFASLAPTGTDRRKVFFVWSDLNGDQRPQPAEVSTAVDDGIQHNNGAHVGGVYVGPDLSLTTSFGLQVTPQRFTDVGVPVYDAAQVRRLVRRLEFHWVPYDAVTSSDGWFITKAEPLRGFRDGRQLWSYPNPWPELHACLREPPPLPQPGQFIGTLRWLGHPVTPRGSDVGEIFALSGYYGRIHLITADGLCVGTLFEDARATGYFNAFEKLGAATPGLLMNAASLQTECFFDTLSQLPDGRIYLQAGKSQCNLVRLDGLEGIRRLPSHEFDLR